MKKYFIIILCIQNTICLAQPPYPTAPPVAGNITAIEYHLNGNDLGFGSGASITGFTPAANINNYNGSVNLTGLTTGFHRIYIRTRDANGKWGVTNNSFFDNYNVPVYATAPVAPQPVTNIEYFIDAYTGFENANPVTGFTPSVDISNYNANLNITGLSTGFHRFYIRSKDGNGKWGLTQNTFFDNYNIPVYATAPVPAAPITNIEYFIDANTGFENATPVTGFSPSANISNYNASLNITGLPTGFHRFYIRSKDGNGKWGLTQNTFFDNYNVPVYNGASAASPQITALEYFIDNNDPGFGNATPISFTPGTNIVGLNANINITGLSQGVHRMFIRSRDAAGKWSITNFSVFDNSAIASYPPGPATAPALSNMEYFIDTDPGFGNATPITVPGNTGNVNNYSININLSGSLSVGTHYLHIRSRQNPWSITNIVPFTAQVTTPVSWLYVKGELINRQSKISWGTASESNTAKFEIEHSTNSSSFIKIGETDAAGNSNTAKNYHFIHTNPVSGFNYYRIKQTDRNGAFKYSAIVPVLNREGMQQTIVAPNPVKDMLHVVEPETVFINHAAVYQANGNLILRKNINSNLQAFSLPVNQLPAGSYLLQLVYRDKTVTHPFIKQ